MRNKEKGITLIALIITIIVMLILVGVVVQVVIQSDLLGTAKTAGDKYKTAYEDESNMSEVTINGEKYASIEDYLESIKPLPQGAGKKFTETKEYNDGTKTAVIPGGFTVSGIRKETTIDEGLVIYLIPDNEIENVKWDGTEKAKYDQFVWVPVTDVNKMFMCQSKTAETECNIELVNGIPTCTNHSNSIAMAGRLYATSVGEDSFNSSLTTQTYKANDGLREPAKLSSTNSSYLNQEEEPNLDLQTEYNNAVKKVIESKGFWIGRYETSGMNSSNDDIAVNIVAGKGASDGISKVNWYRMYKQQQNYTSKKNLDTSKIQSTMVFGAAYDQTMIFANCAEKTTQIKDYYPTAVITGNVETDCYKNIYDLCGNLNEWTTEVNSTDYRVYRGGDYSGSHSASGRFNFGSPTSSVNNFRYQSHTLRNAVRKAGDTIIKYFEVFFQEFDNLEKLDKSCRKLYNLPIKGEILL